MEKTTTDNKPITNEQEIKLLAFEVLRLFSAQLPTFPSVESIYESLTVYLSTYLPIKKVALFEKKNGTFIQLLETESNIKENKIFSERDISAVIETKTYIIKPLENKGKNTKQHILYVPILIDREVTLVIGVENKNGHTLNEHFADAVSLIGSTAYVYAYKKKKTTRLENERNVLYVDLKKQHEKLNTAIETLTEQSTQIKRQHYKKQELTQEIHHRVNNNLQIISSLINLYVSDRFKSSEKALQEIQNRVQTMEFIHQNMHKTAQPEFIEVSSYILDLVTHFKGYFFPLTILFDVQSETKQLSLDTLVPLGLLINEIVHILVKKTLEPEQTKLEISIRLTKDIDQYKICFNCDGNTKKLKNLVLEEDSSINCILASALIEQLEGENCIQVESSNECAIFVSLSNL